MRVSCSGHRRSVMWVLENMCVCVVVLVSSLKGNLIFNACMQSSQQAWAATHNDAAPGSLCSSWDQGK